MPPSRASRYDSGRTTKLINQYVWQLSSILPGSRIQATPRPYGSSALSSSYSSVCSRSLSGREWAIRLRRRRPKSSCRQTITSRSNQRTSTTRLSMHRVLRITRRQHCHRLNKNRPPERAAGFYFALLCFLAFQKADAHIRKRSVDNAHGDFENPPRENDADEYLVWVYTIERYGHEEHGIEELTPDVGEE